MLHKATTSNMSSSDLRELFEACKTGDLIKVKKLLTTQKTMVNEIGEFVKELFRDLICSRIICFQTLLVDVRQLFTLQAGMGEKTSLNISSQTVPILQRKMTED